MVLRVCIFILLIFNALTLQLKAEDLSPNHSEAIEQLSLKANSGDAQAQYQLGLIYFSGVGVDADMATAADWFKKASDQFHLDAMRRYRDMLLRNRHR